MKYDKELYIESGFYGGDFGDDIECHKEKIVKCRKPHKCNGGCENEIPAGSYALCETGFMDGEPVSCYTCLPCIEAWLEESGQVDVEEQGGTVMTQEWIRLLREVCKSQQHDGTVSFNPEAIEDMLNEVERLQAAISAIETLCIKAPSYGTNAGRFAIEIAKAIDDIQILPEPVKGE